MRKLTIKTDTNSERRRGICVYAILSGESFKYPQNHLLHLKSTSRHGNRDRRRCRGTTVVLDLRSEDDEVAESA
ncbi:hypothetical protein Hanom_Chr17g01586641 [Helianthus anomalus]